MLQEAKWFQSLLAEVGVGLETNSTHVLLAAARAGVGIAVLPRFVARWHDDLVRVSEDVANHEVWLLVILDRGRIVAEGSPRELIERHATREVVELRFETPEQQAESVPLLEPGAPRVESLTDRVLVYTGDGEAAVGMLADHGLRPSSILVRRSTLEDVFLLLTGRALED
jgi:hypothetical protein